MIMRLGTKSTNMASSLPSCFSISKPPWKHRKLHSFTAVRSQSSKDYEGNSTNMVDSNMRILRERIEEVKKKEGVNLNTACSGRSMEISGWNYQSGYDDNHKRVATFIESVELAGLVGGSLGLVFVTGSLFIFLVSLLVHTINQM